MLSAGEPPLAVKARTKSRSDALLWSVVAAVLITGCVHALAITLPNWFSARSSRQASSFEKFATHFSQTWLDNAFVLAAVVAGISFVIVFSLLLWRVTVSSRRGNGAG
jgi:ABC-type sulfate transport system permease subunit